jgi:environmental stress-induced protein Ves
MNSIEVSSVAATPWKNGGGVTRELLAWPSAADWRVRISVADVDRPGPFSSFPGVERWFAVLEGAGVRLDVDGSVRELDALSEPFRFDGAAPVTCELPGGPTRDLNLMVRGGVGRMRRVANPAPVEASVRSLVAVFAGGRLAWQILAAGERIDVTAAEAICMEVPL